MTAEQAAQDLWEFRQFLEMTVYRIATILFDAMTSDELCNAIRMIPAPETPPQWVTGVPVWKRAWRRPDRILRGRAKGSQPRSAMNADVAGAFVQLVEARGVVVRPLDHPLGALGVTVLRNHLEAVMLIKGVLIISWNGYVRVAFEGSLPDTVAIGLKGRLLSELVDHPLFNGRSYRIRAVMHSSGTTVVTANDDTRAIHPTLRLNEPRGPA